MSESPLTYWERQILVRMSEGGTNATISHQMGVTEDTVKNCAQDIYRILGARGRAHAVALGYQRGLLGHDASEIPPLVPFPAPPPPLYSGDPDAALPRPADRRLAIIADAVSLRCEIGEALRMTRLRRRWSLPETAEPIGLAPSVLSRVETGKRPMYVDRLGHLCAALCVPPVEIIQQAQDRAFPQGWPHKVESP